MAQEKSRALAKTEDVGIVIDPKVAEKRIKAIGQMQAVFKTFMKEGADYGTIPGTGKPTLLKPGAEKTAKILNCADLYHVVKDIEDWEKPFFYYQVKCQLMEISTQTVISEGIGSANSMEDRYRWRWVFPNELPDELCIIVKHTDKDDERKPRPELTSKKIWSKKYQKYYFQYRIENENVYTQVNTILKIAKKRALVDAALSAGRLSDIFTQDLEDTYEKFKEETPAKKEEKEKKKPGPEPKEVSKEEKEQVTKEYVPPEEELPPEATEKESPEAGVEEKDKAITEQQTKDIHARMATLVDGYKRDPADLLEKIQERLKEIFDTAKGKVPEDLTQEEADKVINILEKTIDKEHKKVSEEEEVI